MQPWSLVWAAGLAWVSSDGPQPHQPRSARAASSYRARPRLLEAGVDAAGALREAVLQVALHSIAVARSESLTEFSEDARRQSELRAEAKEVETVVQSLVDACVACAPQLVESAACVLPLARIAAWLPREDWVRPLDAWGGATDLPPAEALRSLEAHLLEVYDTPQALHTALAHRSASCGRITEASQRVAAAFTRVLADAGAGRASVRAGLQERVCPGITKRMSKEFVQLDMASSTAAMVAKESNGRAEPSPLHALREAQVSALGGDALVAKAACMARCGSEIGDPAYEEFVIAALQWVCTHAQELDTAAQVSTILDYFCEMRRMDSGFAVAGRTVQRVLAAIEQYALSTITFEDDEKFQPNPRGINGFFREAAAIPPGTRVDVPYDTERNGGHGEYKLGDEGERGSEAVTVRIAEILSLKRLIYEGKMLGNCLEGKYTSQVKYVQRARQRVSSFWSLTYSRPGEAQPEHKCLVEVWHLREGNMVRQAEGPSPRTLPSADAFYWVAKWCEEDDIDLSTWNCYSYFELPVCPDEFARKGRI